MITFKGRQIPETLEEIVNPSHTALIIHEMLNDFCTKGGRGTHTTGKPIDISGIIAPMVKLLEEARKHSVRVMYVRYTNYADHRTLSDFMVQRTYDRIKDQASPPPSAVEGTWGHEIIDQVKPQKGEAVINKYRVDSFIGTNLDLLLRSNGVRTIVFMGVGAEAGGVPTTGTAVNLGYYVVVPEDCIRPTHPDWLPDAMKFIHRNAIVTPSTEIIKAWNSSKPR